MLNVLNRKNQTVLLSFLVAFLSSAHLIEFWVLNREHDTWSLFSNFQVSNKNNAPRHFITRSKARRAQILHLWASQWPMTLMHVALRTGNYANEDAFHALTWSSHTLGPLQTTLIEYPLPMCSVEAARRNIVTYTGGILFYYFLIYHRTWHLWFMVCMEIQRRCSNCVLKGVAFIMQLEAPPKRQLHVQRRLHVMTGEGKSFISSSTVFRYCEERNRQQEETCLDTLLRFRSIKDQWLIECRQ